MKAKNRAKEKQITSKRLKNGVTLTYYNYSCHQSIIRAAIDNDYKYIIHATNRHVDGSFNAIVKDDQTLLKVILVLTNKNFNYKVSKIRRRKRKFNPATIS